MLISVGQPSTNPRLVKEADTLTEAGYKVYVIYSYWTKWAWEMDQLLFKKVKWTPILAGGNPFSQKWEYLVTRIRQKFFSSIAAKITLRFGIAEIAKGRAYPELLKNARALKADLYIAHILAALPVAVKAAKKNRAQCGFDIEDLHRFEVSNDVTTDDYKLSKFIEDKYLPKVNYLTSSSPQIAGFYTSNYKKPVTVINNVFKTTESVIHDNADKRPLKLFWFSQTVGAGRGIEDVVKALSTLKKDNFEFHLLGDRLPFNKYFIEKLLSSNVNIKFHNPVAPDEVIKFSRQFDIGLALEHSSPLNRDLCLTNKIFTYMQAGLAIVASKTTAQSDFMRQNPAIGTIYPNGDVEALAGMLSHYQQHPQEIKACKEASLKLARERYNWETESRKFLKLVEETL